MPHPLPPQPCPNDFNNDFCSTLTGLYRSFPLPSSQGSGRAGEPGAELPVSSRPRWPTCRPSLRPILKRSRWGSVGAMLAIVALQAVHREANVFAHPVSKMGRVDMWFRDRELLCLCVHTKLSLLLYGRVSAEAVIVFLPDPGKCRSLLQSGKCVHFSHPRRAAGLTALRWALS